MRSVPSVEVVPGQVQPVHLGKYALLGAIGRGGMADVYLAISRGPSGVRKLVVVKCMRPGADLDGGLWQMFLDEGRLAALLSHANVVHTYEVGQSEEGPYIVMEYLDGQPLSAIQRVAKPLAARLSARIAADALSGLHYAHELRDLDGTPLSIVHRDLSPPNIFVTHDGVVKLVDFGIAKTAIANRALTEAGLVKGKLSYMAPEQAMSGDVDRRADIYAMGVVLWELLTGRRLVEDLSPASIIRHALQGTAPLVSSIRPEVDPALDRIVERALKREPEERFATAIEMRDALEVFLAQGPATGATDLARLMAEHFSSHREQRDRQIQNWVAVFTPEQPTALDAVSRRTPLRSDSLIQQISGAFDAMPRSLRALASSRRRLVGGALIAAVLLVGVVVFAFRASQDLGANANASMPEPAVAAAVAARATDSSPARRNADPDVVPSRALVPSPQPEASTEGRSSAMAPSARPPSASKPPAQMRVARSPQAAPRAPAPRSAAPPGAVGPARTSAPGAPTRPAQPKPRGTPMLENNPYMHSQ